MEEMPMDEELMEEIYERQEVIDDEDVDYPDRTTPIDKLIWRW
jgi:hypothetical protein